MKVFSHFRKVNRVEFASLLGFLIIEKNGFGVGNFEKHYNL
jgi:hypothetical protein